MRHTDATFNPEMLQLARDSRDFTSLELSAVAGVEVDKVSRALAGLYTPTQDEVIRLAAALNLPPAFFYREGRAEPPMGWNE